MVGTAASPPGGLVMLRSRTATSRAATTQMIAKHAQTIP
jgi:hypothetical protein